MDYAEKFFAKIKDKTLEVEDIIEFMDAWLADEASRRERMEKKRQENKCCDTCKYNEDGYCVYWGGTVDGMNDSDGLNICGEWK